MGSWSHLSQQPRDGRGHRHPPRELQSRALGNASQTWKEALSGDGAPQAMGLQGYPCPPAWGLCCLLQPGDAQTTWSPRGVPRHPHSAVLSRQLLGAEPCPPNPHGGVLTLRTLRV